MKIAETPLAGAYVIELEPIADERGSFARSFCEREFAAAGLATRFPQWSVSRNATRHTLRGMHYQEAPHAEIKLVRCTAGSVRDVIVDLRTESRTYCKWFAVDLTAESGRALYIPEGFAHGFQTLTDNAEVTYHISAFYVPGAGRGVRWDDPAFAIAWPEAPARIMSERDRTYPDFVP
ncbi:MAG TPA: dTDP-4-dehydrorhamnose 3,5-epimerase [Hyphomicrobiaceae bacterium]|nr:dTDP-4-dehydrorhamnose 3,5-epimerase [Hyphomicrobiaceae bacterium]